MKDDSPLVVNPADIGWLHIKLSDEQLQQLAVYIAEHLIKLQRI